MWQARQHLTIKRKTLKVSSNPSLTEASFLPISASTTMQAKSTSIPYQPSLNCHWKEMALGVLLHRIKPRKDTEPDGVLECVLQTCTDHLAEVFTNIFNLSSISGSAPTCLKTTTIVPIPKQRTKSSLNDYHSTTLTLMIAKCFKDWLWLTLSDHSHSGPESTEEAISLTLYTTLEHFNKQAGTVECSSWSTVLLLILVSPENWCPSSQTISARPSLGGPCIS